MAVISYGQYNTCTNTDTKTDVCTVTTLDYCMAMYVNVTPSTDYS